MYNGNTMALKSSFVHSDVIDEVLYGNIQGKDVYYHQDGLNSVKKLTDGTGTIIGIYDYDAWGNPIGTLPAIANPFTYTGREWDKEIGMYYYRARYYDAKVGRFISPDPIGFAGGDVNLYSYVNNRPTMFIDPLGLKECCNQDWSDCFAKCVEKERFDLFATIGGLAGAHGFGTMPKVGRELITLGGQPANPEMTSQTSRWGGRLGRAMDNPAVTRAIRDFGRSSAGRVLGVAATGLLVFEGFYDIGAIGRCAVVCTSDACSY